MPNRNFPCQQVRMGKVDDGYQSIDSDGWTDLARVVIETYDAEDGPHKLSPDLQGQLNARLLVAAFNSYEKNCVDPVASAESDLLYELASVVIEAVHESGFPLSGPTDIAAAENGEPKWVCLARDLLTQIKL